MNTASKYPNIPGLFGAGQVIILTWPWFPHLNSGGQWYLSRRGAMINMPNAVSVCLSVCPQKCARGGGCYDVLTTGPARSGCLKWSLLSIEMVSFPEGMGLPFCLRLFCWEVVLSERTMCLFMLLLNMTLPSSLACQEQNLLTASRGTEQCG